MSDSNWWEIVEPAPVLRQFQEEAIEALRALVGRGMKRLILQAPTGAGKTVICSHIIRSGVEKGGSVLFLAHARELIQQASRKLRSLGVPHGIIMAGKSLTRAPVQVASKDTLLSRVFRREVMELPPARLVVVDEAHRAAADWYQEILSAYPRAVVLGLSATPGRNDGRGLAPYFEGIVCAAPPSRLLREGYLVPTVVYAPTPPPDLKGVRIQNGDYAPGQLEDRMNKPMLVGSIIEHWLRLAKGRPTLVFASGVKHSMRLCEEFRNAGVSACHIDGGTDPDERDRIVQDFAEGRVTVLCNCSVFCEGTDLPLASCVVLARPTKSLIRFLQCAGRVQRPHPGKADALLLDHAGCVLRHGFPDDDREWVLEEGRAIKPPSEDKSPPEPYVCPECACVFQGRPDCPGCGYVLPGRKRRDGIEHRNGVLEKLERQKPGVEDTSPPARQKFWLRCLAIAAHKGRNVRSAGAMYRGRYGCQPWEDHPVPGPQPRSDGDWGKPVGQLWPGFLHGRRARA